MTEHGRPGRTDDAGHDHMGALDPDPRTVDRDDATPDVSQEAPTSADADRDDTETRSSTGEQVERDADAAADITSRLT